MASRSTGWRRSPISSISNTMAAHGRVDRGTLSFTYEGKNMKGAVLYGPRDVRFVDRKDPKIVESTDVIIRMSATCVCGSDLWPFRGIDMPNQPTAMGHEYCGTVEEVGRDVKKI